jgi:hypothetical protein
VRFIRACKRRIHSRLAGNSGTTPRLTCPSIGSPPELWRQLRRSVASIGIVASGIVVCTHSFALNQRPRRHSFSTPARGGDTPCIKQQDIDQASAVHPFASSTSECEASLLFDSCAGNLITPTP